MFHLLSSEKEHTEQRVLCKPHMSFFFFFLRLFSHLSSRISLWIIGNTEYLSLLFKYRLAVGDQPVLSMRPCWPS